MNELGSKLFRRLSGTRLDKLEHRKPRFEDIQARALKKLSSNFPIRDLGRTTESRLLLSEEERESHIHILGSPGEGKSKLLELLIRGDIGKYGCCLLDPSDNGDTAYKILKYCAKIGFEKVCLIDTHLS